MKAIFAATLAGQYQIAGVAGVFTPVVSAPDGDPVDCRVILEHPDRTASAAGLSIEYDGPIMWVQVSEIAAPKKGDTITIDDGVEQVFTIIKTPKKADLHRLQWLFELEQTT